MFESGSPPNQADLRMDQEKDMQVPSINISIPSPEPGPDESEYILKSGKHNSALISEFDQLRQEEQLIDVTLAMEDGQIMAHKLVLSACSPYFRSLFTTNPCKHPIIFLKEVPTEHIRLLVDYMYKGNISVKGHDLKSILKTATSLKIRGLTTEESTKDCEKDKFQHIETGSSHSGKSSRSGSVNERCGSASGRSEKREGGRKSSNPKRLRLNTGVSADSGVSSPKNWMDYNPDPERPLVISEPASVSPTNAFRPVDIKNLIEVRHSSGNSSPLDDIAESEGEDQNLDPNQPVDFSKGEQVAAPRFSILGNHVKNSGRQSKTPDHERRFGEDMKVEQGIETQRQGQDLVGVLTGTALEEAARMNGIPKLDALNPLSGLAAVSGLMDPRTMGLFNRNPQQQRPSSRGSRDKSSEDLTKEAKKLSLPTAPTFDMAEQLRSHFASMANLPSQFSPANLPSQLTAANLASQLSAANLANLPSQLSASNFSWLNSVGGVASPGPSQSPSRNDADAKPKNPIGGYKVGEVGINGKQPVECEVCGKRLTDPSSLYRHRKIHSGDKPHKCPYCNRRFIQRYNMKQHIKTHKMEIMADKSNWDLLPKNHDLGEMMEHQLEAHRNGLQYQGDIVELQENGAHNQPDMAEAPLRLQNRVDMVEAHMNVAQIQEDIAEAHRNVAQNQENCDPKSQNQDDDDDDDHMDDQPLHMDDQPLNMSGAQHDL